MHLPCFQWKAALVGVTPRNNLGLMLPLGPNQNFQVLKNFCVRPWKLKRYNMICIFMMSLTSGGVVGVSVCVYKHLIKYVSCYNREKRVKHNYCDPKKDGASSI